MGYAAALVPLPSEAAIQKRLKKKKQHKKAEKDKPDDKKAKRHKKHKKDNDPDPDGNVRATGATAKVCAARQRLAIPSKACPARKRQTG